MKKGILLLLIPFLLSGCGEQGPKGEQGVPGPQGVDGKDGSSALTGTEDPTNDLGKDGDIYIKVSTSTYFRKENGKWVLIYTDSSKNEQGLEFYLLDDGNYGVAVGTAKMLSHIDIPETYMGKSVTKIIPQGFLQCKNLISISIPDSITSIGDYAFAGCESLVSFVVPDNVTSVSDFCFDSCTSLTSVSIPNSIVSIGAGAFQFCLSLTSITIPSSVSRIGENAFSACENLKSIFIPISVNFIGYLAFSGCSNLTIYCEAESEPSGWGFEWSGYCPVVWGYTPE